MKKLTLSSQPFICRDTVGTQGSASSASMARAADESMSPEDLTVAAQEDMTSVGEVINVIEVDHVDI